MPDMASIAAILSSIRTATDIAKFLRESDLSLERAELKLKLADLVSSLAEAKMELAEIQETLSAKDRRIAELEEAFHSKDSLKRQYDAYYSVDENGNVVGVPYCLRCWENDQKRRQLVCDAKDHRTSVCTTCGHRYEHRMTATISRRNE
jgi:hypothetical protein